MDTFVRPATPPPIGEQAQQLANSLSSLVPSLAHFTQVQDAQQRQEMPGKVAAALTGRTQAEQKQILASNPDMQNHMAQKLGNAMLGQGDAASRLEQLRTAYTTGGFDRDGGNFDQFVNAGIQEDLKNNKDPAYAEAYRQSVLAGVQNLRSAQDKYQADKKVQTQDQLVYNGVKGLVEQGVSKGWSADELNDHIQKQFATADTIAHKPIQEQQKVLIIALGRMACGFRLKPATDSEMKPAAVPI